MNINTFIKELNNLTGLDVKLERVCDNERNYNNDYFIRQTNQASGRFTSGYEKQYIIHYNGVCLKSGKWSYTKDNLSATKGVNTSSASRELEKLLQDIKNDQELLNSLSFVEEENETQNVVEANELERLQKVIEELRMELAKRQVTSNELIDTHLRTLSLLNNMSNDTHLLIEKDCKRIIKYCLENIETGDQLDIEYFGKKMMIAENFIKTIAAEYQDNVIVKCK